MVHTRPSRMFYSTSPFHVDQQLEAVPRQIGYLHLAVPYYTFSNCLGSGPSHSDYKGGRNGCAGCIINFAKNN